MNKLTAHCILALFDLAALAACYLLFAELSQIQYAILQQQDIRIQSPVGLYLLCLIIPLVHIISLFKLPASTQRILNYLLCIIFAFLVCASVGLAYWLEHKLTMTGYQHCAKQDKTMSFSTFKTFALNCSTTKQGVALENP